MGADPVAAFAGKKYLSLETYKKSGTPVRTVVWFAVEDGKFYFHTPHKTWKLKRIRKNPAVRMAPSSFRGKILGDWFDGKASFVPQPEAGRMSTLINRRYGLWARIMTSVEKLAGGKRVVVVIEPEL